MQDWFFDQREHDSINLHNIVSSKEVSHVDKIIRQIRENFSGKISVIGSRSMGRRMSYKTFEGGCSGIENPEWWFNFLNSLAVKKDLSRHEVTELIGIIERGNWKAKRIDIPNPVRWYLNGDYGVAGSDLDLLLEGCNEKPESIRDIYTIEWPFNLVVDVFPRGKNFSDLL